MADPMVKQKLGIFNNFAEPVGTRSSWIIAGFGLLTFILSWAGAFPAALVESWFARTAFPRVSALIAIFADLLPIAWLDVLIPLGVILVIVAIRGRRLRLLLGTAGVAYLFFFWTWGLNYHRQPLASKLTFDAQRAKPDAIDRFAKHAAEEINRLYGEKERQGADDAQIADEAQRRVARVVAILDGTEWRAPARLKNSRLANLWFHMAGVDGVFNPLGHEPIINNTLLDVERPFVIAHELAHARGYPNEGDANVIAFFATVMSDNPHLQYSGWLGLWLYLRTRERDPLLDDGSRRDLQRISERARREQIRWISNFQTAILDWYLKANNVEEGVRSYSQLVVLAAGTEESWPRFR